MEKDILANPANVAFKDLLEICRKHFGEPRIKGSHHIFKTPWQGDPRINGLALRGTFIINPEGKLIGSEINFYNNGRNADELMRKMQANVYLANHTDEVCPAKWKEGDKTIKPSAKIVGKIYEAMK